MPTPHRPSALTGRVFRGRQAVRLGLITPDGLRSDAWTRLRQDVYADARLNRDHELACRGALARLPPATVIAGPSAAFLHGVKHAAGYTDDVHVITSPTVRIGRQLNLRVHHLDLRQDEVTGRVTRPARTAWDVSTWLQPIDAVPIVDTLLNRGLITPDALARQIDRNEGRWGWHRASRIRQLVDGNAQSPAESRLRVRLMQAGLPRPVTQLPVRVSPSLVLHPDLGWPEWQVAMEYDGRWHGDPDQLHHDRRRLNHLVAAGWAVLHVTSTQLRQNFPQLIQELHKTLYARGWRPHPRPTSPRPPRDPFSTKKGPRPPN
jgi:very-short-patch-repair endonuclease